MKDRTKTCPGKDLEQISTEELDEILQAELEKESPEESVVLPILQELQKRENDYPVETPDEITENANERRSLIHKGPKKSRAKRRWALRIVAIATILCIIFMAIPRTVGAESVFQVLFRWTESVFEFLSPGDDQGSPDEAYVFETDNQGLQKLYNFMVAMGVQDPVVPMWLPVGYELSEIKVVPYPDGDKIIAKFVYNEDEIIISFRISAVKLSAQYEKDDQTVKMYECGGTAHCLLINLENISVAWQQGEVECMLVTNLDEETACRMIASIYRSE